MSIVDLMWVTILDLLRLRELFKMVATDFLREEQLAQLIVDDNPETMIEKMLRYQHRLVKKWVS